MNIKKRLSFIIGIVLIIGAAIALRSAGLSPSADEIATTTPSGEQSVISGQVTVKGLSTADGITILIDRRGHVIAADNLYEIATKASGRLPVRFYNTQTGKNYQIAGTAEQSIFVEPGKDRTIDFTLEEVIPDDTPTPTPTPTVLARACADEADNDNDTRIDLDDPGCATANGTTEADTFYAPENVDASYSNGQVSIAFKDRTQDETKFYLYRKGPDVRDRSFARVLGVNIPAKSGINNTQTVIDTALLQDTEGTVSYAVTAVKSIAGREVESKLSVQDVVTIPSFRPTAPTDIRAAANNDNSVTVTFQDQSADERGFTIYRTKELTSNRWTWVDGLLAHPGRGSMSYTDTTLDSTDTSTYWYVVTAYKLNSQGNSVESVIKTADASRITLKGANLPTPTNLRQQGNKSVNLFWDHTLQPNDTSAGVIVERSHKNGPFQEIATLSAGTFGYRDKKAKDGRNTYRVRTYRDVTRDSRTTRLYSDYSNTVTVRVN